MVTRNGVISNRWSIQLKRKYMLFQLLSTIKVNLVAKIMQKAYLCVIFHVKHKKLPFLAVLTWFLIFGKIQDGDHCWWRHRPPATLPPLKYTSTCQKDQRPSTKGRILSKYCNISKTPSTPHPHPTPCTTVGVWTCVYVRGLIIWLVYVGGLTIELTYLLTTRYA